MTLKDPTDRDEIQTPNHDPKEVITTHINADFDALASMIAAKKLYPDATLVFPGAQEKNLRNFFLNSASYIFNFSKLKHIQLGRIEKLILVDTRQKSRIDKFAQLVENNDVEIHIYDHHPDSEEDIRGTVEVIDEVGATTSLLVRIIREKGLAVTPDEATIMCLGIHEDTGSFQFPSTTSEDYRAAAWLTEQGANHNLIADMLTRDLSAEHIWLLNDVTQSAKTHLINGVEVVITQVIREEYIGDFAVLVHKFMEMENLNVVFALAQMEDRIYLVARSRIEDVNVAEIALAFGGGGHPQAASATIKNKTLVQVEKSLLALLRNRVKQQRIARDIMSSPVIHIAPDCTIKEAATMMTKYNINVLMVTDKSGKIEGYISRQIVEKAIFFELGHILVREYMNIEYSTVESTASLKEVQDLIIKDQLRVLPVLDQGTLVGVITRTDLLNILVGEPVIPNFLYDSKHASHMVRKKNVAGMLKERLPRRIINYLRDFGQTADIIGYNVYLVGGMVRDIFLKRENLDVDLVVEGDGIQFAHEFARHHNVRVRSHKKFGTAVIIFPDDFKVDVATARIEYYESPAAPPVVETSSLKLDLYRRDFTINTLAVKLNQRHYGTLIDYFGAQKDLKEKIIRVLHNLSFVEDPTRVLRAIRFEQRFGFRIGKLTLSLIKNAVAINCFKDLSPRRLFLELKLLLMEQDPLRAINRMNQFDLLQFIAPGLSLTKELRQVLDEVKGVISWFDLLFLEEAYQPWKVYWLGLTSYLDANALTTLSDQSRTMGPEFRDLMTRRNEIQDLLDQLYRTEEKENYRIYSLLFHYETEVLLYLMAKANNKRIRRMISSYFIKLKNTRVLLKGRDLIDMGLTPGPLFKEIFESLLKARLNNIIRNRNDEIMWVKEQFGRQARKKSAP